MHGGAIGGSRSSRRPDPNLSDYDAGRKAFSWEKVREELLGPANNRCVNIGHLAVDRHADGAMAGRIALSWVGDDDATLDLTYAELRERTNRFANVLKSLGVSRGDRVFALTGRIPGLYIAALGALKNTSAFCPLFAAFGPEPIYQRLSRGGGRVLVSTCRLYEQKVAALRDRLPALDHVILTDTAEHRPDNVWSLPRLMASAGSEFHIPSHAAEEMALLHFTSGTTGLPKGAIHVHEAVLAHYITAKYVLDLHPNDVFWCTADPGWVTGTVYGIIAPLLHGVLNVVDEADFDPERWYRILESRRITVWYTAPTAIRRLMRLGIDPRARYDLSALRAIHSVGEPLHPEAVIWGKEVLGLPIHDNWWQTETGAIMIANFPGMAIRPGSMGRPVPGIEAAIVRRCGDGRVDIVQAPGVEGELALKVGWPSMFRGYLHDEARYRACFADGWYLTGDLARRDADGYFWFVGRADDVIKTSGHMVGPYEVESALMRHPAVSEAGVIGKPHPVFGEIVKAFVRLKPGVEPSDELLFELIGFARKQLGPAVAPREIMFCDHLPKNRAGKIMRRVLKVRELGLPEGDVSTMEPPDNT